MVDPSDKLQSNYSGVRSLVEGDNYTAFNNLADARDQDEAVVIFEGDYGGTIYLTVPVDRVKCDEARLRHLLLDVDAMCWADPEGAGIFFESRSFNSGVAGGMGGGIVTDGLWLHPKLEAMGVREEIALVLDSNRQRINPTEWNWNGARSEPRQP